MRRVDPVETHLDLIRAAGDSFPVPDSPLVYRSARVWHCQFRSLAGVGQLSNLRKLEIAGYPDRSMNPLQGLGGLEHLSIVHLPAIRSLGALCSMTALRRLTLAALPPSHPGAKPVVVDSLTPLASLPRLEEVNLFGVKPADKSVKMLWRIPSLRRIRLADYATQRRVSVELADRW